MNDAVRIARIQAKSERDKQYLEMLKMALSNPVGEILIGTTIVELLYKSGFYNAAQRDIGGKAIIGAVVVQQLAPSIPALAGAASQIFSAGVKAIPAIAGASAGVGGVL